MLPYSWLTIDNLRLSPWEKWQGRLVMSLTPAQQDIGFAGNDLSLQARLRGGRLPSASSAPGWLTISRR